jgi:hypothetical protein
MKLMIEKSLRGHVVKRAFAPGSKSEHDAVCLEDMRGRSYRLRLLGGDPFFDPQLEKLVGKDVSVKGEIVHGNTMIIKQWTEIEDALLKAR